MVLAFCSNYQLEGEFSTRLSWLSSLLPVTQRPLMLSRYIWARVPQKRNPTRHFLSQLPRPSFLEKKLGKNLCASLKGAIQQAIFYCSCPSPLLNEIFGRRLRTCKCEKLPESSSVKATLIGDRRNVTWCDPSSSNPGRGTAPY